MEPLITTIFKELSTDFSGSISLLKPVAYHMLGWFFMYELCSSLLLAKAGALGEIILKATKLTSPRTWANLILWAFLMIGFFFIAFSIIIIWIEFYLLLKNIVMDIKKCKGRISPCKI